jgi:hypothetical protein
MSSKSKTLNQELDELVRFTKHFIVYPDGREEVAEFDHMDAICFKQDIDLGKIQAKLKTVFTDSGQILMYPPEPPEPSVKFVSEKARQEFWEFQAGLAKFVAESDTTTFISFLAKKDS